MALNKRLTTTWTPAGNKPKVIPGTSGGLTGSDIKKVELFFAFETNGAGVPLNLRGDPVSVVRTSTGLYTATLGGAALATGKYTGAIKEVLLFQPYLNTAAGSALRAQGGAIDLVANTFQIRIVDATGTVTDLAAAAGNSIYCDIVFNNGAV